MNKVLNTTSFAIEVESCTDKLVAEAIKAVLSAETRDYYLNEASKLVNA